MRNLPQTAEQFHTSERQLADDSVLCPLDWPMNEKSACSSSFRNTRRSFSERNNTNNDNESKLDLLCNYLTKHRIRLLLTFISLVFLSMFFVVIYRQFGWITFVTLLGITFIPFVLLFIYVKRLDYKEKENSKKMNLKPSETRRYVTINNHVFSTEVEMKNLSPITNEQSFQFNKSVPKRKSTKISIKLPPTTEKIIPENY